jgi:hypothetical protein
MRFVCKVVLYTPYVRGFIYTPSGGLNIPLYTPLNPMFENLTTRIIQVQDRRLYIMSRAIYDD